MRTAKEIIDQAISDNRVSEWLLYAFAVLFVSVGLFALIWGAVKGQSVSMIVGGLSGSLFWPAMTSSRRTRKENIAIRLLEAPLSHAQTTDEAAEMLSKLVDEILRDKRQDG